MDWDDEYLSNTLSCNCPMIMQCYHVKNIQNFKIIKITQRHSYKLIDHTSCKLLESCFYICDVLSLTQSRAQKIYSYKTDHV